MKDIKTKSPASKSIKTLNKSVTGLEKLKDNIVTTKDKSNESISDVGSNKITSSSQYVGNKAAHTIPREIGKQSKKTVNTVYKTKEKIKVVKEKQRLRKNFKKASKGIKTAKRGVKGTTKAAKNAVKVARETVKNAKRAIKATKAAVKNAIKAIKLAIKVSIKAIKGMIAATKALISAIAAGGWVAIVVVVVICLVGMICASIFGIFLSSEKTSSNAITTKDVIMECNKEFSDKLQEIQDSNPHDEFVLDGSMSPWKDVLIIYAVRVSNGTNEQEVVTMNDKKKQIFKEIFWDMNELSSDIRQEEVTEQGVNTDEEPKKVLKSVLHVKITSKTADEMKLKYNFSPKQMIQYNEISDKKYASLWNGVIYGLKSSGEFSNWKQIGSSWSDIKIGNTNSTIGKIGCLVTSIAILIEKSGVPTTVKPFNPGTFVEELNKKSGFDAKGNLMYAPISKVAPGFKYAGNINLRGKSREEKLSLIKQYFNAGYYITTEVKGATPGNQHWVAVIDINGNNVIIADPATSHTDLWSAYEYSRTSQFNYFEVK